MLTFNVNWLAVIVGAVLNMVIGALWYGPLFGKPWMEDLGITIEDTQSGNMGQAYGIAGLNSLLMSFVMANVAAWSGASNVWQGLGLGLILWIGFTGFTFAANHAFEGRKLRLWAINSMVYLAGAMVMGVLHATWM